MEMNILNRTTADIALEGNISADSEEIFKTELKEAERNGITSIILDFHPVAHMDDAGLSSLVKLLITARRYNITLYTCGLSERYRELFEMTGILHFFPSFEQAGTESGITNEIDRIQVEQAGIKGEQSANGWAPPLEKINVTERPKKALLKNMQNRKVAGPLQGFGYLWQKTYTLDINQPEIEPARIIEITKQHFPEFQPSYNRFYPTSKGLEPGENVYIDSKTPGGIVSTGVMVMYADATGFSFITPAGHPEAGWVSFRATKKDDHVIMKIQGLASASDPFYELAFRLAGSKLQENIWKHVLGKLARFIGVEDNVRMNKILIDRSLHWNKLSNIRYNAQIRSLPLNLTRLFGRN